MTLAIRSDGLSKQFGKLPAVEGLDLRVPEGTITAFLGPNGAGKTTTIRLLLGLLKPTSGTCEVLGHQPGQVEALRQLGAMVESPSLYGHLTGYENVEITRLMRGGARPETDRVLEVVGLTRDAHRVVQQYSLGMRQRLAMALALFGNPRLLVLDEPTNGLDPAGIQEIRELIRQVPRQTGATVFLSSHILAEVEQIASNLVVIHRGLLRYQGPTADLGGQGAAWQQIRVDQAGRAMDLLRGGGLEVSFEDPYVLVQSSDEGVPALAALLVSSGVALYELKPRTVSLETRFLALLEGA
ncbi:MAG: ABC transporter ATP-binding protein [Geothrix sp.]|uniref:ABC transporter ATP-binding protein n=1 Tax=Geothrix sp. TaxID=1962974 RepID=UPI0017E3BCC8|nr:ABC transporter ATP-binding protein [Geothrix sp.]NWJ42144.1 ABC transporter ATP-binding protein [Geothrix sp.]WIL19893.1 MAG: ABC transporter ATP-binding protein [Geothrix sp.]